MVNKSNLLVYSINDVSLNALLIMKFHKNEENKEKLARRLENHLFKYTSEHLH